MPDELDEMEKYAVVEDESEETAKVAAGPDGTCPDCGAVLEAMTTTNVRKCPQCGTRPFEDANGSPK